MDWLITIFYWDGALPLAAVAIPKLILSIFPPNEELVQVIAIVIPVIAFFLRGAHGYRCHRNRTFRLWQTALFVAGILLLALWETAFILFIGMQNIALDSDWFVLGVLYVVYLALMAVAFFPLTRNLSEAVS
jgi:hypothetical protein